MGDNHDVVVMGLECSLLGIRPLRFPTGEVAVGAEDVLNFDVSCDVDTVTSLVRGSREGGACDDREEVELHKLGGAVLSPRVEIKDVHSWGPSSFYDVIFVTMGVRDCGHYLRHFDF